VPRPPLDEFAQAFVQIADTLVNDFHPIDFMYLVSDRLATVTGSQAVGVTLSNDGADLAFVGASSEDAKHLMLFQLQEHQGPCLDAFRTGQPVTEEHLDDAYGRWPSFAPRAVQAGLLSVHAYPLRMREQTIGAVDVYSAEDGPLTADDMVMARALADLATIGIVLQRATDPEQDSAIATELLEAADELERIGSDLGAELVRDRARRRSERAVKGDRRLVANSEFSPATSRHTGPTTPSDG
jgi:GAF domain-containing protein